MLFSLVLALWRRERRNDAHQHQNYYIFKNLDGADCKKVRRLIISNVICDGKEKKMFL
jgi:hypothetical protein